MTMRPNFYVISDKISVKEIHICGNYTHKWIINCSGRKAKLSLCLIKYHAMKMYEGAEVYLQAFFDSALDGAAQLPTLPVLLPGRESQVPIG
jgi:hypothetical protein